MAYKIELSDMGLNNKNFYTDITRMIDENQSILKCFEIRIKYNKMEHKAEAERRPVRLLTDLCSNRQ
jgi:hypothetical protein